MVIASHVNSKRILKKYRHMPWIYLGSPDGLAKAKRFLDIRRRIFIAKKIDSTAEAVRDNFVDYIGKVSAWQKDKVLWYSSRIASKAITQTTIFHQYVYLKIIVDFGADTKEILCLSDDVELLNNIRQLRSPGVILASRTNAFFLRGTKEFFEGYVRIVRYIAYWCFFRFFKNFQLKKFDTIIHTWHDARNLVNLPKFNDPYLPLLDEYLAGSGNRIARLFPLKVGFRDAVRLAKHFNNIIHPLAYLCVSDLFKNIFRRFDAVIKTDSIDGINDIDLLSSLAREEVLKENRTKLFLDYLLLFYSYQGIKLQIARGAVFIYTFENQPWEKMLNLAFSDFCRLGYQHTTTPYNWLDYRVSRFEKQPLPNIILASGKAWTSYLAPFYPGVVLKNAGALRFSHLFKKKEEKIASLRKNIVVALPISPEIAIALQEQVLLSLEKQAFRDYQLLIKPHPHLSTNAQKKSCFHAYANGQFVETDMRILLSDCELLITSDSSVAFESVFANVKTVYLVPEQLSLGFEYFIREFLFIAYEENFGSVVQEALNSKRPPEAPIDDYYTPPKYDIFAQSLSELRKG